MGGQVKPCRICMERPKIGRYSYCKECQSRIVKAWRERNREELRRLKAIAWKNTPKDKKYDKHLRQRYGITNAEYLQMLNEQGGVCKICGCESLRNRISVDHCHATGVVRGLLCERCNSMLGRVQDDATLLERAAEYLRASESKLKIAK